MKKIFSLFLVLCLLVSLSACGIYPSAPEDLEDIELVTVPPEDTAAPTDETAGEPTDTPADTPEPTADPTPEPTADATAEPTPEPTSAPTPEPTEEEEDLLDEHGVYTSKYDVANYLIQYGCLPENFITKKEAQDLGWPGGGLDEYAYGMCIGGDRFGNREGLLPSKKGRTYTECDIDTLHASSRGSKRLVFSNDGLIYYTGDHYATFTLIYGEDGE